MTTEQSSPHGAPDESSLDVAQASAGPIPPNSAKAASVAAEESSPIDGSLVDTDEPAGGATEAAVSVEQLEAELNAMQAELEAANRRADDQLDKALRVQADMDNLRKRSQRDVENAHKFALEKFAKELLGVVDSLEMGLSASESADTSVENIREGTELTLQMFKKALEKFAVVEVDPQDQPFDPERHQAVSMQPVDGVASNTVTAVLQKGYTLNDRLIRPAMVMVAK